MLSTPHANFAVPHSWPVGLFTSTSGEPAAWADAWLPVLLITAQAICTEKQQRPQNVGTGCQQSAQDCMQLSHGQLLVNGEKQHWEPREDCFKLDRERKAAGKGTWSSLGEKYCLHHTVHSPRRAREWDPSPGSHVLWKNMISTPAEDCHKRVTYGAARAVHYPPLPIPAPRTCLSTCTLGEAQLPLLHQPWIPNEPWPAHQPPRTTKCDRGVCKSGFPKII